MIKSMTGYGRGESFDGNKHFVIELKSVNHRYLESSVKLPRKFIFLENDIKNVIKSKVSRGKIDVFINYEDTSENEEAVKLNLEVASKYMSHFKTLSETFNITNDITASQLARFNEVITFEHVEDDQKAIFNLMKEALDSAIEEFISSRIKEGTELREDMLIKIQMMEELTTAIKERSPSVVIEYRDKLDARIKELLTDKVVDETRLATEVAIFADRSCIDEEVVRLSSHFVQVKGILNESDSIGRKLDFMSQEMNREANTILSKANDISISNFAISLKTEIEKFREQIQNIE